MMFSDADAFATLVALIYRDIDETQPWFAFVDRLAAALGAHDATVIVYSKQQHRLHYHITSDRHFHWTPQRVEAAINASYMMEMAAPEPITETEFGPHTDFLDSELFREILAPEGIRHLIMVDAHSDADQVVRIAADRTAGEGPFSTRERALLQALAPHLKAASALREKIQNTRLMLDCSLDVMARLRIGCAMLDSDRRIVGCNELAREFFAAESPARIRHGQLLCPGDSEASQQLDRAIAAAIGARKLPGDRVFSAAVDYCGADAKPVELVVKSIPNRRVVDSDSRAAVMLLFQREAAAPESDSTEQLREKHGLSPSEAAIAVLLTQGHTLEEVATLRGVSLNTIKTHLRSLYEKLGLHRRAQLIALLSKTINRLQ